MTHIQPKKILVLKNRAIGDSILSLSTISYLKSVFPKAHICYGVPSWIMPLYQNIKTSADSYLEINLKKISEALITAKNIKREQFDCILDLHQSGRGRKFFKILGPFIRGEYFCHNHNLGLDLSAFVFEQGVRKANIQRDLDAAYSLAKYYGEDLGVIPNYLDYAPKISPLKKIEKQKKIIFGVVATRDDKRWPLEHFNSLAHKIFGHDSEVRIEIPLSMSLEDQNIKRELEKMSVSENIDFVFSSLSDLPKSLAEADLYIGNDTGLKHICASLDIKTYTLFGPEEPLEWHPYDIDKHPFFWAHGYDVRDTPRMICALKQFDLSKTIAGISPDIVFNLIKKDL